MLLKMAIGPSEKCLLNLVLMSCHTPFKAHLSDECPINMATEKSGTEKSGTEKSGTEHYNSLPIHSGLDTRGKTREGVLGPLNLC